MLRRFFILRGSEVSVLNQRQLRADELFNAVVSLPSEEQRAFLDAQCPEAGVRAEVEKLLAHDRLHQVELTGPFAEAADPSPAMTQEQSGRGNRYPTDPASSSNISHGRFVPGTVLAARYRIVGLLGQGGMGEVYRADDLELGQSVALKFLPARVANDARVLERFRAEVRLARQISHANVCRVYDIGQVNGQWFLSMEYVDGEDLAQLLRRIGRFPADRATSIARQLCLGLQAAHERGVVHRDLKPANLMIDARGKLLIMDFGLAEIAEEVHEADIRSGTPAYMSPEQLAGREVTVRSDIYALGLILHEIYTGEAIWQADSLADLLDKRQEDPPRRVSHTVPLDHAVETVIARCLEPAPEQRPSSAISVAAALPGGDPLAAAIAMGETPSPEMVAAAGEDVSVNLRLATLLFGLVIVFVFLNAWLADRTSLLSKNSLAFEPAVLRDVARQILSDDLGYESEAMGTIDGFALNGTAISYWFRQRPPGSNFWPGFGTPHPDFVRPSWDQSDEIGVSLSGDKRLLYFRARPSNKLFTDRTPPPPRWSEWFKPEKTGFYLSGGPDDVAPSGLTEDIEVLDRVDSPWRSPPDPFDTLSVWKGAHPRTKTPVLVVAAAFQGKPTYFQVFSEEEFEPTVVVTDGNRRDLFEAVVLFGIVLTAFCVCWHNVRTGRIDRRGAVRLAIYFFAVNCGMWLCVMGHSRIVDVEFGTLLAGVNFALLLTAILTAFYLALEPYVRRIWPQVLISSSKILDGRIKDAAVGWAILVGACMGAIIPLLFKLNFYIQNTYEGHELFRIDLLTLAGTRELCGVALRVHSVSFLMAFGLSMLLWVCRVLFKSERGAMVAYTVIFALLVCAANQGNTAILLLLGTLHGSALLILLTRFGALGLVACYTVHGLIQTFPLTLDVRHWFFEHGLFAMLLTVVIALAGFTILVRKRSLATTTP